MEPTTAVSAVSAALATTVKLTEKVFEIRAVDKQASSLLETIDEVNGQLDVARELRRQKSGVLSTVEKNMMDRTFQSTESALSQVAKLVEPSRVAMETSNGGIGLGTRLMFVLRDSPNIQTSLTRLGVVSQSLHTSLILLCSKDMSKATPPIPSVMETKRPPSYAESQFLTASRSRNLLRKASSDIAFDYSCNSEAVAQRKPLEGVPETIDETSKHADLYPGRRESSLARNELFLEDSSNTRPRSTSTYSGSFIPYRPLSTNASTTSLQSSLSLPAALSPGTSMSPPLSRNVVERRWSQSARNDGSNSGPPASASTRISSTLSWNAAPALWYRDHSPTATPSEQMSPLGIFEMGIGSNGQQFVAELGDTSWQRPVVELEDTSISYFKKTFAVPYTTSSKTPLPILSKLIKLEETPEEVALIELTGSEVPVAVPRDLPTPTREADLLGPSGPTEGIVLAPPYPCSANDLLGLSIPNDPSVSEEDWELQAMEIPIEMLKTARRRRFEHARIVHVGDRQDPETKQLNQDIQSNSVSPSQPIRPPPPLPSRRVPPPPVPKPRRLSTVYQTASSKTPPPPPPRTGSSTSIPETLSGRARSQRWREAQFEKFEQLQDKPVG